MLKGRLNVVWRLVPAETEIGCLMQEANLRFCGWFCIKK